MTATKLKSSRGGVAENLISAEGICRTVRTSGRSSLDRHAWDCFIEQRRDAE